MNAKRARAVALLVACAAGASCAPDGGRTADSAVRVSRVLVVAPAPGAPAGLYAVFTNGTGRDDSLLGLSTPAADSATLHTQQTRGAMVLMQPVPGVALPAGGAAELSPGALHGMLTGLRAPLAPGDSVPVTFRFAVSPPVTTTAAVVGYAELGRTIEHADHEEP